MPVWSELVDELQKRFQVIDQNDVQISVALTWEDGRSQQVNVDLVNFIEESVALVTSPVIPHSRDAAEILLENFSMPIIKTSINGYLSIAHALHIEHMPLENCIETIAAIAGTADEIEMNLTNGKDAKIGSVEQSQNNNSGDESTPGVIYSGQYVVGKDIAPGVYRFAGYVARLDSEMQIITNSSVHAGLGIVRVMEHDSYFEVNGEAIHVDNYPIYDVLKDNPRGGIYLVNTDLPPGKYRINGDGRSAYYAIYDPNMNLLNNDLNNGSVILSLPASAYAVEFTGRIEKL